jgi:hypothetical protein
MTPPLSRFATLALAGSLLAVWPLVEGCSRSTHGSTFRGGAPALLKEDAPIHPRGGTNPNAPYTVAAAQPQLVKRTEAANAMAAGPCDGSNLTVTEIAAAVNGNYRAVKLAFNNVGETPCRLGGYPSISLLDQNGAPVASVVVDRVTMSTLSARLTQEPVQATATQPDAQVTLAPKGEAWFQLGWATGDGCPVVSRISVSIPDSAGPGSTGTFTVNHPLTVCEGRVQITTLHSGQAVD